MTEGSAKLAEAPDKVQELSVPADEGQLSRVRDFIVNVCESAGFSTRETNNTKLAVDEACTNIIKHAYSGISGDIKVRAEISSGHVEFRIFDTGEHFDFASIKDPDLDQYVETGRKGGLGVFLINRLMDSVDYRSTALGNELVLSKKSRAAVTTLPAAVSWRNSLRFKFTLRAGLGLFFLITTIWAFIFIRQTGSINEQKDMQWVEKKRITANLANRSKDVLLQPEAYSIEQTNLSAYLAKLLSIDDDLAYVRVINREGKIISSGNVDEIFTDYQEQIGEVLLEEESGISWMRISTGERMLRDIFFPVEMRSAEYGTRIALGGVHVGVYEDVIEGAVNDPRLTSTLLIIAIFLVGILLIMALVSVFVKPIQVLTDGVRAIGEGSLDGQIAVDGPAEIGAIASVFNEITQKFKKAQDSILEQEKLQKEMEVAKQIQHSLLPKRMPDVSGYDIAPYYQAAAEVGGDYYDFVQVDDDTVGIVVADVSGKGVPGSLVMTMIRTALRMEARGNKNASDVMSKMNDFVTDDMRKGMFVTMFYVILDSKNRIVSYASAGHNPMVLYRRESNETFFLNPKGFPVGISLPDEALFRKSISLEKIKLKKDDMLLIYTDGVTEAMNPRREQYGEDRLLDLIKRYGHLHPKEFIARLEGDVKKFTEDHPQNDDITVVAIKEKLTADEVLSGLRKKLIDLVEVGGMSVRDACVKMRVSPATYYRYKKRLELLGERGLKDKVLREDLDLKRVSLEERKEIIDIIKNNPEYGAKRIAAEFNKGKDPKKMLKENMIYDELKRLSLNTKELRLDYLRRNKLIEEEELERVIEKTEKEVVEEFLEEVTAADIEKEPKIEEPEPFVIQDAEKASAEVYETAGDLVISTRQVEGDITVLQIEGHLDSVSSSAIERKIKDVMSSGNFNIVVDLSKVSYISSGGWGIFTGEVRRLREAKGDVILVGMTSDVYDVYELLGFADILSAFATVEEAVSHFRLPPEERLEKAKELAPDKAAAGMPGLPASPEELAEEIPGESYIHEWESLKIEATTVGDTGEIAVLSLRGIIDTVSAENLRRVLDQVVSGGINKIVVDMSLVEYVSSGGWGAFTERLREVRRGGGDIKLFGMDPDVYYVFTMLGFNIVLSSFDILTEAIEDFKEGVDETVFPHADGPPGETPHVEDEQIFREGAAPAEITPERGPTHEPSTRDADFSYLVDRTPKDLVSWERVEEGVVVSYLRGSIEASAITIIDKEINDILAGRPKVLIFDLEGVSYISSTGWGIFAKCLDRCAAWGGIVALSSINEGLHEIYRYLEFHSLIPAYTSKDEALRQIAEKKKEAASQQPPIEPPTEGKPWVVFEKAAGRVEPDVPVEAANGADEILSVDDVLGVQETEAGLPEEVKGARTGGEPTGPAVGEERWSEETARGESPATETPPQKQEAEPPPVLDQAKLGEEPPEVSRRSPVTPPVEKSKVYEGEPHTIDVQSAVSDKNISEDKKLRKMGWEKYGEKLNRSSGNEKEDK